MKHNAVAIDVRKRIIYTTNILASKAKTVWAMRNGGSGSDGDSGNRESESCRAAMPPHCPTPFAPAPCLPFLRHRRPLYDPRSEGGLSQASYQRHGLLRAESRCLRSVKGWRSARPS
jgi:hypothetical protein